MVSLAILGFNKEFKKLIIMKGSLIAMKYEHKEFLRAYTDHNIVIGLNEVNLENCFVESQNFTICDFILGKL